MKRKHRDTLMAGYFISLEVPQSGMSKLNGTPDRLVIKSNDKAQKLSFVNRFIIFAVMGQMLIHRFDEETPTHQRKRLIRQIESRMSQFVDHTVLPLFLDRAAMTDQFLQTTEDFEGYFNGVETEYIAAMMRELSVDIRGVSALRNFLLQVAGKYDVWEMRGDTEEFLQAVAPKMFDVEVRDI
jgi:hypothetical protein